MRWLIRLGLLAAVSALAFTGWLAHFALTPLRLAQSPLDFTIEAGSPLRTAASRIVEAGVGMSAWQFTLLGRLLGQASAIKAGSYEITTGITPLELLTKLTRGDVSQAEITFIEGWTFRQMRAAMDAHPHLRHDTNGLSDKEILARLGMQAASAEGLFFPDTYLFAKGSSDLDILRRAKLRMDQILSTTWAERDADLPYRSPYEALILASLVEKETGLATERGLIASVFINRLRQGMLLQTDPSVIYGVGERFDGNLRKRDLLADGPYNTYTRSGLPPTPIAMPGQDSIRAVMRPPRTDFLYFVARGDGSSHFSRSLDEHNRAVARYQLKKN